MSPFQLNGQAIDSELIGMCVPFVYAHKRPAYLTRSPILRKEHISSAWNGIYCTCPGAATNESQRIPQTNYLPRHRLSSMIIQANLGVRTIDGQANFANRASF